MNWNFMKNGWVCELNHQGHRAGSARIHGVDLEVTGDNRDNAAELKRLGFQWQPPCENESQDGVWPGVWQYSFAKFDGMQQKIDAAMDVLAAMGIPPEDRLIRVCGRDVSPETAIRVLCDASKDPSHYRTFRYDMSRPAGTRIVGEDSWTPDGLPFSTNER